MITCLKEYVAVVNAINDDWGMSHSTTHVWYRGQSDGKAELQPSIYRKGGTSINERGLIMDFKLNTSHLIQNPPEPEIAWLYLMQHYGVPTRLLDWTESYLIALYFAVLDFTNMEDGVVWLMDPWSLNESHLGNRTVVVDSHPLVDGYVLSANPEDLERQVKAEYPIALWPNRATPRIIAQKGAFTLHGYRPDSLDSVLAVRHKDILRIRDIHIDGASKIAILRELLSAGVSQAVLFPGIAGLAKEISFKYSLEYLGDMYEGHHFTPNL